MLPKRASRCKVLAAIPFRGPAFVLAVFLGVTSPLHAAFQDSGWGARPTGMGGAFTAIADDSNAPMYNPAGLVQIQWNELSGNYSRLFSGLTLYSGDASQGGNTVNLDQSYLAFMSRPISHFGSWGISWANFNTTQLYREDTVNLSWARNVGDFIPVLDNSLAFGLNIKYLHRGLSLDSLTANDPVFQGGDTAQAVTGDLGLLYKPEEGPLTGWRVGLSALNITKPDVGFGEQDQVPIEGRLGVAYQNKQMPWLVPALDFIRRDNVTDVAAGVESWLFHDSLGVRAGVNNDNGTFGLSYYQSLGKKLGFRLDYSVEIPFYVSGTDGNQRLGISVYF